MANIHDKERPPISAIQAFMLKIQAGIVSLDFKIIVLNLAPMG